MTDRELSAILAARLSQVEVAIQAACERCHRPRSEITILAVTKTVSSRVAGIISELGIADLGESRPQELWRKAAVIPGVRWHLTGHLQRNKLERTVPLLHLLHSADSHRLLESLHDFGLRRNQPVPILLELNCSREAAKGGFPPEAISELGDKLPSLNGLKVEGLMTMASYQENPEYCRPVFQELRALREQLRNRTGLPLPILSMGMSNDFPIAIEEGATMIRLGTKLFAGLENE
jgi:pyridoxal phosphate enzyme (YggS family)